MTGANTAWGKLYSSPLPSTRSGPLYAAFPYPTKISPESVAIFLAAHTEPLATVLDTFAGVGSTGLAALLCDRPTPTMKELAARVGICPNWGPRTAVLYEIGTLGAFVADVLCSPPNPADFSRAARDLCDRAQREIGWMYEAVSPELETGHIRHIVWSELIACPFCQHELTYWEAAVRRDPLRIVESFTCGRCRGEASIAECQRSVEVVYDDLLKKCVERRKRVPVRVYGTSGETTWQREPSVDDRNLIDRIEKTVLPSTAPCAPIEWGDLRRAGYHKGMTHLHHLYTRRNYAVVATMWRLTDSYPVVIRSALRLLLLSYNATHSTLMTRVVVKDGQGDLVLTGAQSGVLYVSGLPVEKNVIEGVARKSKTISAAFASVVGSRSRVEVVNRTSENLGIPDGVIDYVFTDPPFGDYIPYAELNQINELWLGRTTDRSAEIIVSRAQGKDVSSYSQMMARVFQEAARVLTTNGKMTVVFHSARAEVWRGLVAAYEAADLQVEATSILEKVQASFKQTVSQVSVRGDQLVLLRRQLTASATIPRDGDALLQDVWLRGLATGGEELTPERLYSRYIGQCLKSGFPVAMDARDFYARIHTMPNDSA